MFTFTKPKPDLDSILSQFQIVEAQLDAFVWDGIDEEREIQAQIDALMVARENKNTDIHRAANVRDKIKELIGG